MTKNTPGPWELSDSSRPSNRYFVSSVGGTNIARVLGAYTAVSHGRHWEESAANARLIAAAPELLEALTKLLPSLKNWLADVQADAPDGWQGLADDIGIAEAAIHKAVTGEPWTGMKFDETAEQVKKGE